MSDKMSSFHTCEIFDPDVDIGLIPQSDGSYIVSVDHSRLWLKGDLDVLLNVVAKMEALLEHEQIMRRKFDDLMLEQRRAEEK